MTQVCRQAQTVASEKTAVHIQVQGFQLDIMSLSPAQAFQHGQHRRLLHIREIQPAPVTVEKYMADTQVIKNGFFAGRSRQVTTLALNPGGRIEQVVGYRIHGDLQTPVPESVMAWHAPSISAQSTHYKCRRVFPVIFLQRQR